MQLVLDTNIVLDLLVFRDPATVELANGIASGAFAWIATTQMRDELERVLAYPKLAPRVARLRGEPQAVLADFDRQVHRVPAAPKAAFTCGDADDQKFIDLAVAHRCLLLSKDFEVLRMARRLARLEAAVFPALAQWKKARSAAAV